MSKRESKRLEIVANVYADHDAILKPPLLEVEASKNTNCDLCCGQDGEILLRNFTIQEAQNYFGMQNRRVIIKCPSCGSYNLLAAALEEKDDGSFVTLPSGK